MHQVGAAERARLACSCESNELCTNRPSAHTTAAYKFPLPPLAAVAPPAPAEWASDLPDDDHVQRGRAGSRARTQSLHARGLVAGGSGQTSRPSLIGRSAVGNAGCPPTADMHEARVHRTAAVGERTRPHSRASSMCRLASLGRQSAPSASNAAARCQGAEPIVGASVELSSARCTAHSAHRPPRMPARLCGHSDGLAHKHGFGRIGRSPCLVLYDQPKQR